MATPQPIFDLGETPVTGLLQYRDGMRLWTSKMILLPEYWSKGRKRREAERVGTERILRGVVERYGDERPLHDQQVITLPGQANGYSGLVFVAYVPCNYEEQPGTKIVLS